MALIVMTREIAQAASWDAANRSMRAAGRTAWDEDDANVAWAEFNRLWPLCEHKIEPESYCYFCEQATLPVGHPLSHKLGPRNRPA